MDRRVYVSEYVRMKFLVFLCFIIAGCASLNLSASYDEQIDKGITSFHRNMESHFFDLEDLEGKPEAEYVHYRKFYRDVKAELNSLRLRAEIQNGNDKTLKLIDELKLQLSMLVKMHKGGLKSNDLIALRSTFNIGIKSILAIERAKKHGDNNVEG